MTLVEVLVGITLLALICTISFSKINLDNYKVNSFIRQLNSDIRYVRMVNKLGNSKVYIVFTQKNSCKGYILMENGTTAKGVFLPKNINLNYSVSKILFDNKGAFYMGGTTINVGKGKDYTEITIVPVSGRVLIKEGIYK
ncbi:MAG: Tfp pilus assembly protein FimT/FimU [Intestinibacter sp.]|uniref:pilus assembly FimT family protein n=1 Tax=Intestinibacter sp. TaxID=1965304 RepID=UPI003F15F693